MPCQLPSPLEGEGFLPDARSAANDGRVRGKIFRRGLRSLYPSPLGLALLQRSDSASFTPSRALPQGRAKRGFRPSPECEWCRVASGDVVTGTLLVEQAFTPSLARRRTNEPAEDLHCIVYRRPCGGRRLVYKAARSWTGLSTDGHSRAVGALRSRRAGAFNRQRDRPDHIGRFARSKLPPFCCHLSSAAMLRQIGVFSTRPRPIEGTESATAAAPSR